jgi:predicted pyridoxine 5'-phosphate oxidase superfamily flavin-nucleotide-binding protein
MAKLTPRMRNWLNGLGGHIATASREGVPAVIVVDSAVAEDETLRFPLSERQRAYISANLAENSRVAVGPGGIGSVRAAYQFKGDGRLENGELVVSVDEIYSTKPGPEAGARLDVLPYEEVLAFESSRWRDNGPPR